MRMAIALAALPLAAGIGAEPTRQALYNSAQAAFDQGDWQAAADGFAKVLLPQDKSSRTDGMIRARYASALLQLARIDDVRAATKRAMTELPGYGLHKACGLRQVSL